MPNDDNSEDENIINIDNEPKEEEKKEEDKKEDKKDENFPKKPQITSNLLEESNNILPGFGNNYNTYGNLEQSRNALTFGLEQGLANSAELQRLLQRQNEESDDILSQSDTVTRNKIPNIFGPVINIENKLNALRQNVREKQTQGKVTKKFKKQTKKKEKEVPFDQYQLGDNLEIQTDPNKVYHHGYFLRDRKPKPNTDGNFTENLNYTKEEEMMDNYKNYTFYDSVKSAANAGFDYLDKALKLIKTAGYVYTGYQLLKNYANRNNNVQQEGNLALDEAPAPMNIE